MANIYLECARQFSQVVFTTGGFANEKKKTADIPVSRYFIFYINKNNMKLMWTRLCIPTSFGIVSNKQHFFVVISTSSYTDYRDESHSL